MKSNKELRSFVTFFAFWISWSVIFALNGAIEALYFGYHWGTAVIFGVGTLLQTVMFLLGWRAVRRA